VIRSPAGAAEFVAAPDGVQLAVYTDGDPQRPPILLVHGFPDTHRVWDTVAAGLARDHYVIRYDVRGAGASIRPTALAAYHLDRLADDLFAVADAVSPDRPLHLAGHDWGSIQSWHAATDPRAANRIASFTGPAWTTPDSGSATGSAAGPRGTWRSSRCRPPAPGTSASSRSRCCRRWPGGSDWPEPGRACCAGWRASPLVTGTRGHAG
jgi:pimeloyl-ACP methyl ester carboxylesterase